MREIPSAPRYFATEQGEIIGPRGLIKGYLSRGYRHVKIQINRKGHSCRVNWLVCKAYHGLPPTPQHEAAHGDGDKLNNVPNNLRWATPLENTQDKFKHKTVKQKDNHPNKKVSSQEVAEIRLRYDVHLNLRFRQGFVRCKRGFLDNLASDFGTTIHIIKDVTQNRSWKENSDAE